MNNFLKQILFIILILAFTPFAFALMPVIVIAVIGGGIYMIIVASKKEHHLN